MEIFNSRPIETFGADTKCVAFSFQCNATSNPSSTTFRGPKGLIFTVTYSATGVFTIVFDASHTFPNIPYEVEAHPQAAVLATDWFDCYVAGEFNIATRTIVVQAHRSGTGQAPANTAGNRINVNLFFRNTTAA
jgi:hypothetical protein